MSKFDWESFLGGMATGIGKTAPEMFKDIRAQEITKKHYEDWANIQKGELAAKEKTAAYNQGLKEVVPEPAWTPPPTGGIGGPVAGAQIRDLSGNISAGPGSLSAAEGSYDILRQGPVATPTPDIVPTGPVPAAAPAVVSPPSGVGYTPGGPQQPATLDEVRKQAKATQDPREQARLQGQIAQLEEREDKEIKGDIHDLETGLSQVRKLKVGHTVTQQRVNMLQEQKAEYLRLYKDPNAQDTPEQKQALLTGITVLDKQIEELSKALVMTPASVDALSVDIDRFARSLALRGVDPRLINEYRRAYEAGDSSLGYYGRQIIEQAKGSGRPGKAPQPRAPYSPSRPIK